MNITNSNHKGFIDNPEEIEKIVKALADTPVSMLKCSRKEAIFTALAEFMTDAGMNAERKDEVTYSEALLMMDGIVTSGMYEYNGRDWCRNMRYNALAHLLKMLMCERKLNIVVHAFMSVTVKSYLCYLAGKIGLTGKNKEILYETFRLNVETYIGYSLNPKTTIEMLLTNLDHFQSRCWLPAEPIEEFEKSIRDSYICLYMIMLEYYKKAFKEEFKVEKLQEKYKK